MGGSFSREGEDIDCTLHAQASPPSPPCGMVPESRKLKHQNHVARFVATARTSKTLSFAILPVPPKNCSVSDDIDVNFSVPERTADMHLYFQLFVDKLSLQFSCSDLSTGLVLGEGKGGGEVKQESDQVCLAEKLLFLLQFSLSL